MFSGKKRCNLVPIMGINKDKVLTVILDISLVVLSFKVCGRPSHYHISLRKIGNVARGNRDWRNDYM